MTEPEVSVPAVIRSYHEVLRNDLARVLSPLAAAGDVEGFAIAWHAHTTAAAVLVAMEDGVPGAGGGSAAMLDYHFDGAARAAMFATGHSDRHALQAVLSSALSTGRGAVRQGFASYRHAVEAHLRRQEDTLMPLVARLPAPQAPLFAHWCVSAGIAQGGFDHFVAHGVQSLSKFGSSKNTPAGATRVFVHALKTVCTPAQWAHYLPLAHRAAAPGIWAVVLAEVPSLEAAPAPTPSTTTAAQPA